MAWDKMIAYALLYWRDRFKGQPRGRMTMTPAIRTVSLTDNYTWQCDLPLRLLGSSGNIREMGP